MFVNGPLAGGLPVNNLNRLDLIAFLVLLIGLVAAYFPETQNLGRVTAFVGLAGVIFAFLFGEDL
jgi:hypothetical protein